MPPPDGNRKKHFMQRRPAGKTNIAGTAFAMARQTSRSLDIIGLIAFVPFLVLQVFVLNSVDLHPVSENLPSTSKQQYTRSRATVALNLTDAIGNGLRYAKSIKDTERKLLFVHIPKAAGTTLEEVGGKQAKAAWGSCLFNHRPKRPGGVCRYPPGQFEWPTKIGYWHLPPQLFPLKGINPYENADLFVVVREPLDRLLSEYYYICRREITKNWDFIDCNRSRTQDPLYMNEWIREKLKQIPVDRLTPKDFLRYNGHYTPQSQFLISYPSQIRMVDYVLQMDELASNFNTLMGVYGLSAEMLAHKKNVARNGTAGDLQVTDFDSETLSLCQERYGDDMSITSKQDLDA